MGISQFWIRLQVKSYYRMDKIGGLEDITVAACFHCCNLVQNAHELGIEEMNCIDVSARDLPHTGCNKIFWIFHDVSEIL